MKDLLFIPNLLTLFRLVSIFPIIYFFEKQKFEIGAVIITVSLLTDFFDGYFARKLNQTSFIGAILDPVADKFIVIFLFGYLINHNVSPNWYFLIIFVRNISQLLSIPILLFWKKIQFKVKPKNLAKLATTLTFIILIFYLLSFVVSKDPDYERYFFYMNHEFTGLFIFLLLLISVLLEIYILITFIPRFIQIFKGTHDTFE